VKRLGRMADTGGVSGGWAHSGFNLSVWGAAAPPQTKGSLHPLAPSVQGVAPEVSVVAKG
jgi:hypothetical protein